MLLGTGYVASEQAESGNISTERIGSRVIIEAERHRLPLSEIIEDALRRAQIDSQV